MADRPLLPHVTDHALVRYLERVMGLDMGPIRAEIEARVADGVTLGASAVVSNGFCYTLSANRVTTVMPRHHAPASSGPRTSAEDE